MKNYSFIVLLLVILNVLAASSGERKLYVVYLGEHSGGKSFKEIEDHHCSFLHSVKASTEETKASLVHSYKNVINGFSAWLTPQEADRISGMEGVISVFHDSPLKTRPHTTRSWDFNNLLEEINGNNPMGREELLHKARGGQDVIVGIMDYGVWPESPSFSDRGMEHAPIPLSWKGVCKEGHAFTSSHCNKKLIGAQYFLESFETTYGPLNQKIDYRSARDVDGHGTHAASTVGGQRVPNAAAYGGFGNGTASGGAPLVRLAIYKVCWRLPDHSGDSCQDGDILKAFDQAISDGVHVISVSLGAVPEEGYHTQNAIAIGALHAVKNNIVVSCSAGNDGPKKSTVENVAPWIITVGASSMDRLFLSPLKLGNGMVIEGQTITPINMRGEMLPLVYAGDVEIPEKTNSATSGLCKAGTLSENLVRGRIVACRSSDTISASQEVQRAGGAATIQLSPFDEIQVQAFLSPTTVVFNYEFNEILKYIRTDVNPTATLLPGETVLGAKPAPVMAPFSSRGPNTVEPNILKPDITAPGFNILAAWSGVASPTNLASDPRRVKYNIISGTSMSCPHVSAVAALLKAIHPHWSSAAIRSAIMTTATSINVMEAPIEKSNGYSAGPFEYGSGHILPSKSADPGLVYDASYEDYLLFICNSNFNLKNFGSFKCPEISASASNLNYPSLSIAKLKGSMTVKRTVTNVGKDNSMYNVTISPPFGYDVTISPMTLRFNS
ncbi:PREDICTED: subtilisin-like protease SBT5.6 [Ipomoea nil]|uniref:subtilisin-like protease SBT5.6 n=1 Tax=Ipomoea nil TaxID=35883 RepID=UPI000900D154|nr:PREDICTED: subtilisin-like protease SBT5.6 [Ipomoea nil]